MFFKKISRSDIEVIFVDDCSTDTTWNIIQQTIKKNKNIIAVRNKKNMGVSYSRNVGITYATGQYIMFLDSDDGYDEKIFDVLDKIITTYKYDIIKFKTKLICNNNRTLKDRLVREQCDYIIKNKADYDNEIKKMYTSPFYNSISTEAIKTSIIKNNKLLFNERHLYAEDLEFNSKVLKKSKKIYFCSLPLYKYTMRAESTTNTVNYKKIKKCLDDVIDVYFEQYEIAAKDSLDYIEQVIQKTMTEINTILTRLLTSKLNKNELAEIINITKSNKKIVKINQLAIKYNTTVPSIYKKTLMHDYSKANIQKLRLFYGFKKNIRNFIFFGEF